MVAASVSLICLIGLPASGKTKLAREMEVRFNHKYNIKIISFDNEISWHEDICWKSKRKSVCNLVISCIEKNMNPTNKVTLIILDDNMFYRSMRYEYYQVARNYKAGFCEICLRIPLDVCLKFNKTRAEPIPDDTIINMSAKLEVPDSDAFKWEKNHLILGEILTENDWKNLESMIQCSLQSPAENVDKIIRKTCTPNFLHSIDIALRKIVNELIKKKLETEEGNREYCHELAIKRRLLLEKIRNGEIVLPENYSLELYSQLLSSEVYV